MTEGVGHDDDEDGGGGSGEEGNSTDPPSDAPAGERRTYDAVVDRFEGDLAVLVVEKEATTELVLGREALPEAGREQDAVLRVTYEEGTVVDVALDPAETESRRESAAARFERLAQRPPGSGEGDGEGSGGAGGDGGSGDPGGDEAESDESGGAGDDAASSDGDDSASDDETNDDEMRDDTEADACAVDEEWAVDGRADGGQ